MINNKVYWKVVPLFDSFFKKKLLENREKIFKIFHNKINYNNEMSFLDVGTKANTEKNHNLILQ